MSSHRHNQSSRTRRRFRFLKYPAALIGFLVAIGAIASSQTHRFTIENDTFRVNGKAFEIVSGEMHYARIPREYWRDRLLKAKYMGLNTIATYVFWNVHEPRPGGFDFSGRADVAAFVRTAGELGLFVILRPGPYACAEWDFGGYPSWLLKEHDLKVRSQDPRFLAASDRYLHRLGEELAPLQNTRGGPIIMVQVENEYGSFGSDTVYEGKIRDMIKAAGFDVPLFTADGPSQMPNAVLSGVLPAVNGATGPEIFSAITRFRPNGPFFVPEFYPGWLDHWGEPHSTENADTSCRRIGWILSHGISVSFYMVHGGTNFGFMNGANYGGHYQPQPTSYDYDAPIDEAGRTTPKYFKLRETIRQTLGDTSAAPVLPPPTPVIEIPPLDLRESCPIFDALPPPTQARQPLSMEDLGQSYGYILYSTTIDGAAKGELDINGLRDYAIVMMNRKKIASLDRRYKQHSVELNEAGTSATLDILVENGGRINYGQEMLDNRKGILGSVTLHGKELTGWSMFPLPFDSISSLRFGKKDVKNIPAFHRAKFTLRDTGDTFLDMGGWGKGCVWINGHNLGRYWYIGPQQTLYVPGVWLRRGENSIVVLEIEERGHRTVRGLKNPILDSLATDRLKPPRPVRHEGRVILDSADVMAGGSFADGDSAQNVRCRRVKARYVCLESLSSQRGDHFASIAEFYLFDDKGRLIPRTKWSIVSVDCEELDAEDGHAENAIDDDPSSIWHTLWGAGQPDHPHTIVIDLGEIRTISGFRYLPRHGRAPGKIKDFRFFVRREPFEFSK